MPRTIPEIRDRLHELADEIGASGEMLWSAELHQLADETKRRAPLRRASPRRRGYSEPLAEQIRAYAAAHPRADYHEIADACRTNIGRVSEALTGKRGES